MHNINDISLALSGGGVRAMAFHCGVLRYLAEQKKLEHITHISSVSGGSLLIGLIFSLNSMSWPTSDTYLIEIEPKIERILTTKNLQKIAVYSLLAPQNWKYILSRANILSKTIKKIWNISEKINDLPKKPIWSINGATAETGKRFRFKDNNCGDYLIGYKDSAQFYLSDIMAASAAFPIGIGPFVVENNKFERPSTEDNFDLEPLPSFKRYHIYDGGIYDNLGMEPFFDIGNQKLKKNTKFLIVSDAGLPLRTIKLKNRFHPFRIRRIADIALDQNRALRVRAFTNFLKNHTSDGMYIQIGTVPTEKIIKHQSSDNLSLLDNKWLSKEDCYFSANYLTNLYKILKEDFEKISLHGYETTKWNKEIFKL